MDLAPAGVLPVTLVGWITAIGLLLTLVLQFIQMGRFLQKLDTIREDVIGLKNTHDFMDQHLDSLSENLKDLVREWRGADGTNGGKSQLRDHELRLRVIENRHVGEDAITKIELERGQGERRRLRDKLIDQGDVK